MVKWVLAATGVAVVGSFGFLLIQPADLVLRYEKSVTISQPVDAISLPDELFYVLEQRVEGAVWAVSKDGSQMTKLADVPQSIAFTYNADDNSFLVLTLSHEHPDDEEGRERSGPWHAVYRVTLDGVVDKLFDLDSTVAENENGIGFVVDESGSLLINNRLTASLPPLAVVDKGSGAVISRSMLPGGRTITEVPSENLLPRHNLFRFRSSPQGMMGLNLAYGELVKLEAPGPVIRLPQESNWRPPYEGEDRSLVVAYSALDLSAEDDGTLYVLRGINRETRSLGDVVSPVGQVVGKIRLSQDTRVESLPTNYFTMVRISPSGFVLLSEGRDSRVDLFSIVE